MEITKRSYASCARDEPRSAASRTCLRSPEMPDTPRIPATLRQGFAELVDAYLAVLLEVEQEPRIDRARAGGHHQTLERRKPHGGVDRPTAFDRRDRTTAAQMADDQARGGGAEKVVRSLDRVRHAEPMETETANTPPLRPLERQAIAGCRFGQVRVKSGVERRHLRNLGESGAYGVNSRKRGMHVLSGESRKPHELFTNALVDDDAPVLGFVRFVVGWSARCRLGSAVLESAKL